MRRNNLPNPMLHEIRSANTRPTRTALPHKSQPYAKTIERMAGVGYNRNREVSALLNAQTKGRQIGGRVNPETDYSRFGDLPNKKMAIQQNKFLKPTNDQAKEMLRSGNANRRVIAKSRYVNGIAGKGFEGENLVIPKRGRPYKGQPNSLPLITKSKKIKKHETGIPHSHSNPNYDVYREMYGKKTPKRIEAYRQNIPNITYGFPIALGFPMATEFILDNKLQNTPFKTLNSINQLMRNTPLGYVETPLMINNLIDALNASEKEIQYNTGDYMPRGVIPSNSNSVQVPEVDIEAVRSGNQTLNPLSVKDSTAFDFLTLNNNQFLNGLKDLDAIRQIGNYELPIPIPKPLPLQVLQILGAALQGLPQLASTLSFGNLNKPKLDGEIELSPLTLIDNLLNDENNPMHTGIRQGKARQEDLDELVYGKINPTEYAKLRNELNYTNFDDLPESLKQEYGRFAFPEQRRMKPTLNNVFQDIMDSQFGGNVYMPVANVDNSPYAKFRNTFGARGQTNAMAENILTQVKGWNKQGKMQDLLANNQPLNNKNEFHSFPLTGNKKWESQNYFMPGYPNADSNWLEYYMDVDFDPMLSEKGYTDISPSSPKADTMFNLFYSNKSADEIDEMLQNEALKNDFMIGAQISNTPANQYANFIRDKRWGEKLYDKLIPSAEKYSQNYPNMKFTQKRDTIQKSMNNKTTNKYFVEKGKKK